VALRSGPFRPLGLVLALLLLAAKAPKAQEAAPDGELTLFLAGDTVPVQPWSDDRDPQFLALVDQIRAADVTIVNLETLLHDYEGYAQADSGGTYMASRPALAGELAWAGIDMLATANNHSFDYGSIGILENLDNIAQAGLLAAGTGKDLQTARAPAYFDHPDGSVALVSATAAFPPCARASASRPDMHGRPGVNPLAIEFSIELPGPLSRAVRTIGGWIGLNWQERAGDGWRVDALDVQFREGGAFDFGRGYQIDPKDLEANLAAVRAAAARAEIVVFSLHAHSQAGFSRDRWLGELARQVIDAGADVILAHGPHRMHGIEIHQGRPIFYSPGNFVFELEQIERYPSDYYERLGLSAEATPEDVRRAETENGTKSYPAQQDVWEGFAAVLRFDGSELREVRAIPLDLGFGKPLPVRGTPRRADPTLGRRITDQFAEVSRAYGTQVRYLADQNAAVVELP
jgi:poly-gamma-glutamate capsule biosynthesis protein CapA/YwtB (metallophosphatase superfamily)